MTRPDLDDQAYQNAIDHVEEAAGVELKIGVGRGRVAADAGIAAKHALEGAERPATTL